ncbi:hypothetical protein [Euzebya tangerina]|uniref:UGSC family (seleno)protein n=1 Tax=Euzebya tangerina TaxID=591198 RepID=UPI0013C348AB|nr:hypothetical protein [Euzebya tangerina]
MPATLVMTEPFTRLAANFSATLGMPGYPAVVVPHPVASLDDGALDALADSVLTTAEQRFTAVSVRA